MTRKTRDQTTEPNQGPDAGARRWALALILGVYLAAGALYIRLQPWNGGLDEVQHQRYVMVLATEYKLPYLYKEAGRWVRYREAHAMHPPAYHLLLTPVYLATRGSTPVMRAALRSCSLLIGALALAVAFRLLLRLFRSDLALATAASLLVALTPHYLLISAVVNNDILSVLLFLLLLDLATARDRPDAFSWRRTALLGLVGGLCALTKGTVEVAALAAGVCLILSGARPLGRGHALGRAALFAAILIVMALPWHLRNLNLYGTLSYMPDDGKQIYLPVDQGLLVCVLHDNFPWVAAQTVAWTLNTLWSQMDWVPESSRSGVYTGLWLLVVTTAVGGMVASRLRPGSTDRRVWLGFAAGGALLMALTLYIACCKHMGWMWGAGRYVLCLLPAVAAGIVSPAVLLPRRARWVLVGCVAAACAVFNAACLHYLVAVLIPMYA